MPIWTVASHAFRNIPCITLFHFFYEFGSIFDQRSELLVVLSVVLSSSGLFSLFSFLVRCVFLLLHLFSSPCFEFQVVRACWVGCPASFVALLVLFLRRVVLRASICLHIEGRSTKEFVSGQTGGGPDVPAAVVIGVLLVGYLPPPGKGKEKISEIRYPDGSEYLRAAVRYAKAVGPSWVEPSYAKAFAIRYRPPFGVRIWCPNLLTSYVVLVPKMVCFFLGGL